MIRQNGKWIHEIYKFPENGTNLRIECKRGHRSDPGVPMSFKALQRKMVTVEA